MSEIKPMERANLRRVAATAELCCLKNIPLPHSDLTDLLNALEAAEARAEKAEAGVALLRQIVKGLLPIAAMGVTLGESDQADREAGVLKAARKAVDGGQN